MRRQHKINDRSQTDDTERDWLEFARKLAVGARAKLSEDRLLPEAKQSLKTLNPPSGREPIPRR